MSNVTCLSETVKTPAGSGKILLLDVCIIRFILIFLLVLYHAFAIFCGAWTPLDGYPEIRSYRWIGKASYSFMLEAFVFISGYVFGYQVLRKPEKLAFNSVATSKAKRLLLPSIIFSVIYYCLFYDFHKPIYEICYSIINGTGHLWFLPMLFWCFIFTSLAEKTGINRRCVTAIAIALSFVSVVPLPFRLSSSLYYFIFFYVGYILKRYDLNADKSVSRKNTILSVLAYIVIFTGYLYEELLESEDKNIHELLKEAWLVIDGPFDNDKKDLSLKFRGSSNQRIIDSAASIKAGKIILANEYMV